MEVMVPVQPADPPVLYYEFIKDPLRMLKAVQKLTL